MALRHPDRRPRGRRLAVRLDDPRQLQERGRAPPVAADLVAAHRVAGQLRAPVLAARLRHLLHQLGGRRGGGHGRQPAVLLDARLRAGDAGVPREEVRLPRRDDHADDPRRGDLRAAVRPRGERRADRHAAGPDPAVPRQPVRRLPHAAVHHRPAARPDRRRPRGRRRRAAHLRPHHPAAVRPGAGDAGDPDVPRQLEQLPLAAGGRPDRRRTTPCPSPWRSTPRARTARSTACSSPAPPWSCCRSSRCSWSSSAASSRASPPRASSDPAGSRRLARVPAPLRTPTDRTSTHGQQHRDSLPPPAHRGRGGRRRDRRPRGPPCVSARGPAQGPPLPAWSGAAPRRQPTRPACTAGPPTRGPASWR